MGSRRQMAAAALVLCVMAFYTSPAGGRVNRPSSVGAAFPLGAAVSTSAEPLTNGDFLRFHVIGNSDSAEDQALKLKVRDGLLETIDEGLALYTMTQAEPLEGRVELTLEQSREYVAGHLDEIAEEGQRIVRTLGYEYPVTAALEICEIPEKTYGSAAFPEGQYEALNVTIGTGEGKNWWCVLFPPLCLVGAEPTGTEVAGTRSGPIGSAGVSQSVPLAYENVFLDPRYDQLIRAVQSEKPVKLELRFKTLELIGEARGQ